MTLIRHKRTLVERDVPEQAVKFFPDYEVVKDKTKTEKPTRSRQSADDTEKE